MLTDPGFWCHQVTIFAAEVLGVVMIVLVVSLRASQHDSVFLQHKTIPVLNVAIGSILLAITLLAAVPWCRQIARYWWSDQQLQLAVWMSSKQPASLLCCM